MPYRLVNFSLSFVTIVPFYSGYHSYSLFTV